MKTVIELLNEKNHCLEKFFRLNEAELENFANGVFEGLEGFYAAREGLLEIIRKVDEMIERSNDAEISVGAVDATESKSVENALSYKNELVARILEQDLRILSNIEQAKSNIIKELTQVRAARKAVGAYGGNTSGENLDEEA